MKRVLTAIVLVLLLLMPANLSQAQQVIFPSGTAYIQISNLYGDWVLRVTDTTTGSLVGNWTRIPGHTWFYLVFPVKALHNYQIMMLRGGGQTCRDRAMLVGYWNFIPQGDTRTYSATVQVTPARGDVNFDGVINILDLTAVSGLYGLCEGQAGYNPCYDLDWNRCIGIGDMTIISSSFNRREPYWYGYISMNPSFG